MHTRRGIFFQLILKEAPAQAALQLSGYRWGLIDRQVVLQDHLFEQKDRRAKALSRLAQGHFCYGFFDQAGMVAYYMWYTVASETAALVPWELNTRLVLNPKDGYIWDCFTSPDHRRRGLYREGLRMIIALFGSYQIERYFICCMRDNIPSIDAIRSMRFRDIFEFTVSRAGPFVLYKRNGAGWSVGVGMPTFNILSL
ncbi:GNAT family N-acetyltransferase [Candidatus Uhrbacteria bacterium]|nr:GNAT family N-acetyltransferase [Candidatus Uhrbacteria bacterium]